MCSSDLQMFIIVMWDLQIYMTFFEQFANTLKLYLQIYKSKKIYILFELNTLQIEVLVDS
jgi:hypothetical protein